MSLQQQQQWGLTHPPRKRSHLTTTHQPSTMGTCCNDYSFFPPSCTTTMHSSAQTPSTMLQTSHREDVAWNVVFCLLLLLLLLLLFSKQRKGSGPRVSLTRFLLVAVSGVGLVFSAICPRVAFRLNPELSRSCPWKKGMESEATQGRGEKKLNMRTMRLTGSEVMRFGRR